MDFLRLNQLDVFNKRVLLRCDYNVPIIDGVISDDTRILETLPTLNTLLNAGARVIICSHLGRPKGEFNEKYSLLPIAKHLSNLLKKPVNFCSEINENAVNLSKSLKNGEVLLLENLRFYSGEEKNDPEFSKRLASLADVYVLDAFGTAHRAHSSTEGVTKFVKACGAGLLLEKEITFLNKLVLDYSKPFVAILGGAKVSDKMLVIKNLLNKVDVLLIGGGMAFTFLSALGVDIGNSIVEKDKIPLAKELMDLAKQRGVKLLLPVDFTASTKYPNPINEIVETKSIDLEKNESFNNYMGLDIGKKTANLFCEEISKAKTIVWNGPLGVVENPLFCLGTNAVAKTIANSKALSVIGGGDSIFAVNSLGLANKISHISTGGGAFLEFLEGKTLPSINALSIKNH